jgi:Tfp pilus assembly protein PilV
VSLKTLFLAGAALAILATGPKLLEASAAPVVTAAPVAVADTSAAPAHAAIAASSTAKPVHTRAPKTATPKPPKTTTKPAPKPKPSRWVVYTVNVDYSTSDAGVYSVTCTTVDNQGAHSNPARMRDVTISRAQYDRFADNPVTSSIPCPR